MGNQPESMIDPNGLAFHMFTHTSGITAPAYSSETMSSLDRIGMMSMIKIEDSESWQILSFGMSGVGLGGASSGSTENQNEVYWETLIRLFGVLGGGNGQGDVNRGDPGVEGDRRSKWSSYDKSIDVETYNCIGLAFRTYEDLQNLDDIKNFLEKNNRGKKGKEGDIQFVLWEYEITYISEKTGEVIYSGREAHLVAGVITKEGVDPDNVYSKNGHWPVFGPADIYS